MKYGKCGVGRWHAASFIKVAVWRSPTSHDKIKNMTIRDAAWLRQRS